MKKLAPIPVFLFTLTPLLGLNYAYAQPVSNTPFTDALHAERQIMQDDLAGGVELRSRKPGDNNKPAWATFASDKGDLLFLTAGTLLPLVTDGKAGKEHSLRTLDALLASTILVQGLKVVTHEKRPDGSDFASFPSGHASAAFTIAAMQAHYHPHQALYWYGGAALIGASRVVLDKHYTHDVLAGAALGYFTAKFELKQKHGFVLRPFLKSAGAGNRIVGLSFKQNF